MRNHASEAPRLRFFGIGKILPYLKNYRKAVIGMIAGCLFGSLVDIGVPLFQRYALNHFIGGSTAMTISASLALMESITITAPKT